MIFSAIKTNSSLVLRGDRPAVNICLFFESREGSGLTMQPFSIDRWTKNLDKYACY